MAVGHCPMAGSYDRLRRFCCCLTVGILGPVSLLHEWGSCLGLATSRSVSSQPRCCSNDEMCQVLCSGLPCHTHHQLQLQPWLQATLLLPRASCRRCGKCALTNRSGCFHDVTFHHIAHSHERSAEHSLGSRSRGHTCVDKLDGGPIIHTPAISSPTKGPTQSASINYAP